MPPKASTTTNDAPPSPASVQQRPFMPGIAEYELPKTNLIKLAKGSIPDNVKMQQDVVTALLRSSTLFINFLSAHAHDQALERSGKSITAGDVLKAVTELDFGPADALVPILEQELAAYRAHVAATKAAKKKPGPGRGKRKSNAAEAEPDESMAVDDEEEEEEEQADGDGGEGDEGDEQEGQQDE